MKLKSTLANQIKYLTAHETEERLFNFLEEQFGRIETFNPSMSKKDIASAIGTTPETFSRLLLRLKSENKLDWIGNEIYISPSVWQDRKENI